MLAADCAPCAKKDTPSLSFAPPQPRLKGAGTPSCAQVVVGPQPHQPATPSPRIWTTPGAFCHARAAILDEKRVEKPGKGYQRTSRLKVTAVPASVNSRRRFRASDCNDWVLAQCHKSSALCQNPFLVMLLPNSSLLRSQPLITNWWAADVS